MRKRCPRRHPTPHTNSRTTRRNSKTFTVSSVPVLMTAPLSPSHTPHPPVRHPTPHIPHLLQDDEEELKDAVMEDMADIFSKVDKGGEGVCVQVSGGGRGRVREGVGYGVWRGPTRQVPHGGGRRR